MTSPARTCRLALAAVVAVGVLGTGVAAAGAATPSPSPSAADGGLEAPETAAPQAAEQADEQVRRADEAAAEQARQAAKAHRRAAKDTRRAAATGPAFVCDPALSHGQNVSAYARSLPKGPGRGRLVSQAARSDCGKSSTDD